MGQYSKTGAERQIQTIPLKNATTPEHVPSMLPASNVFCRAARMQARSVIDSIVSAVALNFQTPGEQMDLNQGRFLPNGRCGYILKPSFLCSPKSNFNPENTGGGPGHIPTQLTIRVSVKAICLLQGDCALFISIKALIVVFFDCRHEQRGSLPNRFRPLVADGRNT